MKLLGKDIKGVIFDIDGVLLDSMEIWTDLGARYLVKHGIAPRPGLARVLFSMSMEQGAEYLHKNYLSEKRQTEIADGLKILLRAYYFEEVQAKNGALALMQRMQRQGVLMTAATSSPRAHVEAALARNHMLEYLDWVFTNEEVGSSKHSPEIYNQAAHRMNTRPEETCVIEDSLYAISTAKAAGYFTVGVFDENGEPDQEGMKQTADIYIKDMSELQRKL